MVKTCPNCGTQLADNIKFCTGCGANVENVASTFCPNCGAPVESGLKFCTSCGGPVRVANPVQNGNVMGMTCPACGSTTPVGSVICPTCGYQFVKESHTAAIVIGYLLSFIIPIGGIIAGIYLLTRNNKDVHIHGVIMIVISVIMMIFSWILVASLFSNSYYYSYY